MSDRDLELSDLFGDDFEDQDLDARSFSVDDFETEYFDEEEEGGINRTFLVAGVFLIATFVIIVVAILLLIGGDDSASRQETADAIRLANYQIETGLAQTGIAVAQALETQNAATMTAAAAAAETAAAAQTQTQSAYQRSLDQTATQRAVHATMTQYAVETLVRETQLALTPSPEPPKAFSLSFSVGDGQPLDPGFTFNVYRDDGDQRFNPPPTPTPIPTSTPTWTPFPTRTPTLEVGAASPTLDATEIAATRNAEVGAFDATATARAEQRTPTPPQVAATPTIEQLAATEEVTGAVTDETTDEVTTDVTEEPVISIPLVELNQEVVSEDGQVTLSLPATWVAEDLLESEGVLVFGDNPDAIQSRLDFAEGADTTTLSGLGGQIIPLTLEAVAADSVTPELLTELLQVQLEIVEEDGGQIVDEAVAFELENGVFGRYAVVEFLDQSGFVAYLGFNDSVVIVTLSSAQEVFDSNREIFFGILQSVRVVPTLPNREDGPLGPARTDDTGAVPHQNSSNGGVVLVAYHNPPAHPQVFQVGPTSTPPVEGDNYVGSFTIGPDGTIVIVLPPEPGTYFLEGSLPPGEYAVEVEGQRIDFTVPPSGTIQVPIALDDRTLILVITAITVDTPTPSITPTLIDVGSLSPFLQTATAIALTSQPGTPTPTQDEIPATGLFSDGLGSATPEGLSTLALVGVGLLGVVFVVRRLRSSI